MSLRSHVVFPVDGGLYNCQACDWAGDRSAACRHVVEHQYQVAPSKVPLGDAWARRRRPRRRQKVCRAD